MLEPKKLKHRKVQRHRSDFYGVATRGTQLSFGKYGLKAVSGGEITARQIEAARKVIARYTKRGGKIWINIFPHKPITKKALEVPMGSGKGSPEYFVSPIQPGRILFEMEGVPFDIAKEAMVLAGYKLPVKCKFVTKDI
ncbi:MAG: 50S ribosomal protein L16 [Candidatus Gracilibacteria bacterium]|jgi:large subunit ribosomal protein L16